MNLFQFLHNAKRGYFEDRVSAVVLYLRGDWLPPSVFCTGTQAVCANHILFQLLAGVFMFERELPLVSRALIPVPNLLVTALHSVNAYMAFYCTGQQQLSVVP